MEITRKLAAWWVAVWMAFPCSGAAGVTFRWDDGGVRVAGVSRDSEVSLHVVDPEGGRGPAMFAETELIGPQEMRLAPVLGFSAGRSYQAVVQGAGAEVTSKVFTTARERGRAPVVTAVMPASAELPANLLKFYISFSEPMREGRRIFDQIHLETVEGARVKSPWRRQELWNQDATRLTLWIHPGRVKRGVSLRESMGPVLVAGRACVLVVDGSVRSAAGREMGPPFRHRFLAVADDHLRPDPGNWTLEIPVAGSGEPLVIRFGEVLDGALVRRHLSLRTGAGEVLELARGESLDLGRAYAMHPQFPWRAGRYQLVAGKYLEDLAGNTPTRLFETDLTGPPGALGQAKAEFVGRWFEVVPAEN